MAPEGRKILSISLIITSGLFFVGLFVKLPLFEILGGISSVFLVFSINFFRDPDRKIPEDNNVIVAPADGKITKIQKIDDPDVGKSSILISTFMSVFDVHINRYPIAGKVISVDRKAGQFVSAYRHDAVDVNEQVTTIFDTEIGTVKVKQIAGILARRIHCYAEKGVKISLGDRLGFIMFGSRADVILPPSINVVIKEGQHVKGIETVIGKY